MAEWAPKRFWTEARATEEADGWGVALDGRAVQTPNRNPLRLPTRALAEMVAEEWQTLEDRVDPGKMPATRLANTAQERVVGAEAQVAEMLARYGQTDLLCYRAEAPEDLAERQRRGWDPLLSWVAERHGARLAVVAGIVPVEQDRQALARLSGPVRAMGPHALSAFHELVTLSGSLVLGLAVAEGRLAAEEGWALSRIDEDWQIEQWGEDEEAARAARLRRAAFLFADRFLQAATGAEPARRQPKAL